MRSFLSIQYVHGDLCKHLGIYSSTDHQDFKSFKSMTTVLSVIMTQVKTYITLFLCTFYGKSIPKEHLVLTI